MRPNKPHMDENGQWKSERNLALQHRTPWVDYTTPGTYMLTLCTNGRKPIFGRLIIPNNKAEQALSYHPLVKWSQKNGKT